MLYVAGNAMVHAVLKRLNGHSPYVGSDRKQAVARWSIDNHSRQPVAPTSIDSYFELPAVMRARSPLRNGRLL